MDLKRLVSALRGCRNSLKAGQSFHAGLIKRGVLSDMFVANSLISSYINLVHLDSAQKLFDEIPDKNIVMWTTMVSAYNHNGRPGKAIKLYTQMLDFDSEVPNEFMYSAVLKACALVGDLEFGRLIQERIYRENLKSDVVLMNSLLDMYVKNGSLTDAKKVFSGMLEPNITSWNTVISGHCKAGLMDEAASLFSQMPRPNVVSWNSIIAGFADKGSSRALEFLCRMHKEGFELDGFTLPCALKACSYLGSSVIGKQLHCCVIKSGLQSSCHATSALINMYSNCSSLKDAVDIFNQYSSYKNSFSSNLAVWNSMLSGFMVNEANELALNLLLRIYRSGVHLDTFTFSSALKACINLNDLTLGRQVQGLVVISGYELDCVIGSILVCLYATIGNINNALKLFHRLSEKDVIAWSGLIMSCAKKGFNSLAFSLFRDMIKLDLETDQFIISSVLKVCSSLASIGSGKQIHALCVKNGYESEPVTATALIDMYVKCGEIENGLALFEDMPELERDVVCWTGVIVGCGQNGRVKEAIRYFHEMIDSGTIPNEITYLGVLSACRHSGMVEEACSIFEAMVSNHGLEPHLEHYYCMVDLLGQAGRFKEAEQLIDRMRFEPDKTIWSCLLAACGIHKNAALAGVIAEQLLSNFPEDPSVYVMLSNVYATLGMWDRLSEVREAGKELGIKVAGKSWIELV